MLFVACSFVFIWLVGCLFVSLFVVCCLLLLLLLFLLLVLYGGHASVFVFALSGVGGSGAYQCIRFCIRRYYGGGMTVYSFLP